MPFVAFHDFFPELAERETRSITVLPGAHLGVPPAEYGLLEMYCNERGCDCRRVFFLVVSSARKAPVAVISYGWEDPSFYAKWMKIDDPEIVKEVKGPVLNRLSQQSTIAAAVLRLVRDMVLPDEAYVNRLKSHYWMVRHRIDGGTSRPTDPEGRRKHRRGRARLLAVRQREMDARAKRRG